MSEEIITRLVYPDPFKPAGLEFVLPEPAEITITIIDACGQVLATLLKGAHLEKGTHTVTVPPKSPSGDAAYITLTAINKDDRIQITKKLT